MLSEPFNQAKPILETIEAHNHQAYFVGGCVRDYLLKRPIGDVDITTSASPEVIQNIFEKVIPVGIDHGTVVVIHNDISYEVTTFRIEGDYSDKRHPDSVTFIDQIDKDLERRDFTINALAMDLTGNIIDLFDGKEDLKYGIIRTVGNGYERFKEDSLRIIRALRFSSQLGFQISHDTLEQMKNCRSDIENLAVERIANEFAKLFAGDYVMNGIQYLRYTRSHEHLPIFKENPFLIQRIPKNIQPLTSFGEVIAFFHLLHPDIGISEWENTWKCSNLVKQEALELVKSYQYFNLKGLDEWMVYKLDPKFYNGIVRLINILKPEKVTVDDLYHLNESLPIHTRKDLCINGNDLINLFPERRKGPWVQHLLNSIEKKIVYGKLPNRKNEIKEWIKWNPPEQN